MSCRNVEEKLYLLKRCGCPSCEREYYRIRDSSYHYDYLRHSRPLTIPNIIDYVVKDKKVENENLAIKMLVDKLKVEQEALEAHEQVINNYKKSTRDYTIKKQASQKNIKQLSDALKKLGHKNA